MNQNAGGQEVPFVYPLTRTEKRILASGGGAPSIRRRIETKAAARAAWEAAQPDAAPVAPVATAERPEDRREFRNLSKDDYRKSAHLLSSIAGFADLLATL
jgi:hypothetical protein